MIKLKTPNKITVHNKTYKFGRPIDSCACCELLEFCDTYYLRFRKIYQHFVKYLIPLEFLNYMILLKTPNNIIKGDKEHKLREFTITSDSSNCCSKCSIRFGICDRYIYKIGTTICSKFRIPRTRTYHDTTEDTK